MIISSATTQHYLLKPDNYSFSTTSMHTRRSFSPPTRQLPYWIDNRQICSHTFAIYAAIFSEFNFYKSKKTTSSLTGCQTEVVHQKRRIFHQPYSTCLENNARSGHRCIQTFDYVIVETENDYKSGRGTDLHAIRRLAVGRQCIAS